MSSRYIGSDGEATVRDYLTGIGAEVVASNVTLAGAEIDVIARENGVLAFIEVKRRTSARYGRPAEAVNAAKQKRILRAAALYLAQNHLSDVPVRFDVIELLPGELNHIRSAFGAGGW